MADKWTKVMQLEEAIEFVREKLASEGASFVVNESEFD
jgi:hypothetical protein